jgi:hypothetical protein
MATAFVACDDGGTEPQPISLTDLANQLSRIQSGVILQDPTQASADDLRKSIGFIMTNGGFPSEAPPAALAAPREETQHGRILDAMKVPGPVDVFEAMGAAAPPRPPLGVTCDWNPDPEFNRWKLDPDNRLGAPPGDGIRFELYTTQGELPVIPLQPIGTYLDVRPIAQGTSAIDVVVDAAPANTQDLVLNYALAGTSTPDLINLFMDGFIDNPQGTLDFFFTIDEVRGTAGATVEDLILESSIGVDFSGLANNVVVVTKLNSTDLEYDFDFNSVTRAITRGEVTLDNQLIATMTGTQSAPIFNIVDANLGSQARSELTSILINTQAIGGRITDFFLFAHCVGSERPDECERL